MNEIWQCTRCGATFPEYVNGCPHHPDAPASVELVLEAVTRAEANRA